MPLPDHRGGPSLVFVLNREVQSSPPHPGHACPAPGAVHQLQRRLRAGRAHPRHGAQHRRHRHRQPDRHHPRGGHDAAGVAVPGTCGLSGASEGLPSGAPSTHKVPLMHGASVRIMQNQNCAAPHRPRRPQSSPLLRGREGVRWSYPPHPSASPPLTLHTPLPRVQ